MANEITALEGTGNNRYQLLFLYPIATPEQVGGSNVVPTPSAELPEMGALLLTTGEKSALDAGTAAFEVVSFTADPTLTNPQLVTRAREIYAARLTTFNTDYAERYKFAGARVDAV